MGQHKKAKALIKKADKDFPDDLYLTYAHAILSLVESDTITANQYIDKFIALDKDYSLPEAGIMKRVAEIYSEAGILNKAEEYYRKALSVLPKSPSLMNNLAYFLIDKDRNINEGMELVNKGLELNPDEYSFLHTKGWGLYKQGKYLEAADILQKSWDLRMQNAIYDHKAFLHLEAAKKAGVNQKNN
jgi:Tfp pilus assembly protein PilF